MGLFRDTYEARDINGYSNEEFMRLLGINIGNIDKNKLGEITYYTCAKLLSEGVAKLPLKFYKETSEGIEKAADHYLYQILKTRPNQYLSSWNFWSSVQLQTLHYGNSYVYIDTNKQGRSSGKVKGLYILSSDCVQIWVDDAGIISNDNALWYVYRDSAGKEYKLNHQQVLHFKSSISLDGGITGLSVQDCLKTNIENAQAGQKFINSYFKNGLFAKGLLQYTGGLNDEKAKDMQKRFEAMSNGIQNAGRILPVPLGFSFATIDNKLVDSQFLELNKYTALQIAAACGIQSGQLNFESKYNNLEMQQRAFYVETLLPILTMIEQEINWKLLTENERKQGYFFKFNVDSILRASFKERMEGYATAITNGVMKPSECREKEDLPYEEDSNKLIVNGTYIPLNMVGQQYTSNS